MGFSELKFFKQYTSVLFFCLKFYPRLTVMYDLLGKGDVYAVLTQGCQNGHVDVRAQITLTIFKVIDPIHHRKFQAIGGELRQLNRRLRIAQDPGLCQGGLG
jgi:hypothetical protein